ncbi:MAG: hypothetical protein ACOY4R_18705 [Pseudomonadota bacterium]
MSSYLSISGITPIVELHHCRRPIFQVTPRIEYSLHSKYHYSIEWKHGDVVRASLSILRRRFVQEDKDEGFRKDGPVAVAQFEKGEGDAPDLREARLLRQREASDLIGRLLALIG